MGEYTRKILFYPTPISTTKKKSEKSKKILAMKAVF